MEKSPLTPDLSSIPDTQDCRRARSDRTRQQIIEAVLKLVEQGEIFPSSNRVAEAAKVGSRTVYRHFEDLEDLYVGIAQLCEDRFMPIFTRPYRSTKWRDQLSELLDRRIEYIEQAMFMRISSNARRHQSEFLMQDYIRFTKLEFMGIESIVPKKISSKSHLLAAIDVTLSFETYRRLRQERKLSPEASRATIEHMVDSIIA